MSKTAGSETPEPRGERSNLANRISLELQPASGRDTFAAWQEALLWLAQQSLADEADRPHFAVSLAISQFEGSDFSRVTISHTHKSVRTIQDVGRTGLTQVSIRLFVRGGERGRCGGRECFVREGDINVLDFAQPFDLTISPCTVIALSVPRDRLPASMRDRNLHGRTARPGTPAVDLLCAYMRAMDAAAERGMGVEECGAAAQALLMLAQTVFEPAAESVPSSSASLEQDLFFRACVFIEDRIGDPGLSPNSMAEALKVSRASLYRAFEHCGGVGAYVRERRLLRIHEVIAGDLWPASSLGEIAVNYGFAGEAQFGRAFKERFGVSPGVARKAAQTRRQRGEPAPVPPMTPGVPPEAWRSKPR